MNRIFIALFCITVGMSNSFSGEVTGAGITAMKILKSHNIDVEKLKENGHKVLFGELTGAGKFLNLDRVYMILTTNELFHVGNSTHIEFKNPSQAKSFNDVEYIEYGDLRLPTESIKAMVVK